MKRETLTITTHQDCNIILERWKWFRSIAIGLYDINHLPDHFEKTDGKRSENAYPEEAD